MNIAIFGDSFANGETGGEQKLNHAGLTQYLFDDGHFVVNFSHPFCHFFQYLILF